MEKIDLKEKQTALGVKIAHLRHKRGLSLEKLAYESGVSKGNLSDIENGKKNPRLSTLILIAEGLEISVSSLLRSI